MTKLTVKIKNNRIARIIIPICLLLICTVGITIAFIITNTNDVKNTFIPKETDITIVENFDGKTKDNVKIKNEDNSVDVFIRVKLIHNWYRTETDGTVTSEVIAGKSDWKVADENKVGNEKIFCTESTDDWFYCESDGYYYYKCVVQPGASTSNLINKIKLLLDTDGTHQGLEIIAEAIQADGKSLSETTGGADGVGKAPVELAWPNVKVGNDGELTLAKNSGN